MLWANNSASCPTKVCDCRKVDTTKPSLVKMITVQKLQKNDNPNCIFLHTPGPEVIIF